MINTMLIILIAAINFFTVVDDINKKSVYFEKYLSTQHKKKIEGDKHYYIVINAICQSCFKAEKNFLENITKRDDVTLIISSKEPILPDYLKKFEKKQNVLRDKGKYYKLNITPLTDGLIVTEKGEVQNIIEIHYWNIEKLNKFLK